MTLSQIKVILVTAVATISGSFIVILILTNLGLKSQIDRLNNEIKVLTAENQGLLTSINFQNEQIRLHQVDIVKYRNQKPKIVKEVEVKYKTITEKAIVKVPDEQCQQQLQLIQEATNAYFNMP